MKKLISILLISVIISSCSPKVVYQTLKDTTYIYQTEIIKDTIVVTELPKETFQIETLDTISFLETSVAFSNASISNGILKHSISNKKDLPVKIEYVEVEKEIYRDREVPVEVVKEVTVYPKLFWWLLGYTILSVILLIIKLILKFKK